MRRHLAAGLAALLATTAPWAGAAANEGDPIGATLSVINVVTAAYNRDTRTLQTGDNVRQNELIDVSADASTELKLNDDTKLALGPGAKLLLDKFVYDADKSAGNIGVDLVQGAFRFITGVAKKPSYVIKVPRASITVRGTIFDVYVQPDDTTWLLLHEGAVTVCNERGRCRDHDQPGRLIRVTDDGEVDNPVRWASLDGTGKTPFETAFPFVVKPPAIDPNPLFTADEIIKLGAIDRDPPRTRRASDDDDKPSKKKRKKAEKSEEPKNKPKRSAKVEDEPVKKPAVKVVTKKEKTKKTRTTSNTKDDEAAKKALGLAIGIGVGIGIGKIGGGGGGGRPKGGDYGGKMRSGNYR